VGLVIAPTVPLDDLAEEHLRALLGEVAEARDLDFKRELPTHDADGKREFLKDVSSLANSGGGDLVYGIDEDNNGVAAAIVPQDFNPDEERLRWEQVLLHGVDPRIPGVRMRPVDVEGGRVLLVRVPQSWNTPHAVTFGGMFRFYSRHSTGVYQLDVAELGGRCRRVGRPLAAARGWSRAPDPRREVVGVTQPEVGASDPRTPWRGMRS
jgi:predicted HTH transcriptional regulator